MKRLLYLLLFGSLILSSADIYAADTYLKGRIISTIHNRLKVAEGDMIMVNLGRDRGIIKGDILNIASKDDPSLINPMGACAVLDTYEKSSKCEIFKSDREIGFSDIVFAKRVDYRQKAIYPVILDLLNGLIEPYEPSRKITLCVHDLFNENKDISLFSKVLKEEMIYVFSQKKRLNLVDNKEFPWVSSYYPDEYSQWGKQIRDFMKTEHMDLLVSGLYKKDGDKIRLTFIAVDMIRGPLVIERSIDAKGYDEEITTITAPYTPVKRIKSVPCNLYYKLIAYTPKKNEIRALVNQEGKDDPFLKANLKRVEFNIVTPVETRLVIDDNPIETKAMPFRLILTTGVEHRISASFKKGFYFNNSLVYTSIRDIKKEASFIVQDNEEIDIHVLADPKQETIDFKFYKVKKETKPILRKIEEKEISSKFELFID